MKQILIHFLLPIITIFIFEKIHAQTLTDSTVLSSVNIRFATTYQTTEAVNTDSLLVISSTTRRRALLSPLQLPISALTQSALNTKQASGSYVTQATTVNGHSLSGNVSVTATDVGLGNIDNTSDINKPVSTAQATAIAARGYTLSVQALTSSPADGQTIYFGQLPKAPVTAAATSKIYIRKEGTIKAANIFSFSGTAGTGEAWVMSIRLNNTTDTQIASVASATNERVWSNTSLNIAVSVGDYIEIKAVNPTFATNPLTCIFSGYLYIE